MASFWNNLRKDFPIVKKSVYLDHASGGMIPLPVAGRIKGHLNSLLREGDFDWFKWLGQREAVREKVARFIGADAGEITFTTSTSHGMNLIAELLAREGKVLTNESEFPSSTLPWVWRKASMIFQKEEACQIPLTKLETLLAPDVKTVVTSYVQYATGFRQDLETLGKVKGKRYLVVNATQGFGAFPVNVRKFKADFLCANSYKWLMGGYGGGILFIRRPWLKRFKPSGVGWRSVKDPDRMDNRKIALRQDAGRYELGCPSFTTIFALGAAVDYLQSIGIEKIADRIMSLTGYLIEQLEKKGFEVVSPRETQHRSGIVVFRAKHAQKLWKKCIKNRIFVSLRGQGIRVAPHFYNNFEELDRFIKAVS